MSTPHACAPSSLPCSARMARPGRMDAMLCATSTAMPTAPQTSQYSDDALRNSIGPMDGNGMPVKPSTPPVNGSASVNARDMSRPNASVAMAR